MPNLWYCSTCDQSYYKVEQECPECGMSMKYDDDFDAENDFIVDRDFGDENDAKEKAIEEYFRDLDDRHRYYNEGGPEHDDEDDE